MFWFRKLNQNSMDMMSTLNILISWSLFPVLEFLFSKSPNLAQYGSGNKKCHSQWKGIKLHILDLWVFHIPITWPKKTKAKIFVYIICLVRAQFWKCVRFSDFLVTLGLRSQISDDSSGEISLDDKRFRFESKSLERGQTFCRRKNNVMYLYFLEELFHQLFSFFSVVRPKHR